MSNKIIRIPFHPDPQDERQKLAVEAVEQYIENSVLTVNGLVGPEIDKKNRSKTFRSMAELGAQLESLFDQYYFTNPEDRKDYRIVLAASKLCPMVIENALQQLAWRLADQALAG